METGEKPPWAVSKSANFFKHAEKQSRLLDFTPSQANPCLLMSSEARSGITQSWTWCLRRCCAIAGGQSTKLATNPELNKSPRWWDSIMCMSELQSTISASTMESKFATLLMALRALILMCKAVKSVVSRLNHSRKWCIISQSGTSSHHHPIQTLCPRLHWLGQ